MTEILLSSLAYGAVFFGPFAGGMVMEWFMNRHQSKGGRR